MSYRKEDDEKPKIPPKRASLSSTTSTVSKGVLNKSAYVKLQRSTSSSVDRSYIDHLKEKYEAIGSNRNLQDGNGRLTVTQQSSVEDEHGLPRLPKPQKHQDENYNLLHDSDNSDLEDRTIIVRQSSEESVDKIEKELSHFTMDKTAKDKKQGGLRRLFSKRLFGKDKTKRDKNKVTDLENKSAYENNQQNELRVNTGTSEELTPEHIEQLDKEYAQMHINKFAQIRQSFAEEKPPRNGMGNGVIKKPTIADYLIKSPSDLRGTDKVTNVDSKNLSSEKTTNKIFDKLDTSTATPPRARETHHNIQVATSKPASYQNAQFADGINNPQTIERNLNKSDTKRYPPKLTLPPPDNPSLSEAYGTVFDALDYGLPQARNSPSPFNKSLESSKLKLPSNRMVYNAQPKSPMSPKAVSTDKVIATELLKNSRPVVVEPPKSAPPNKVTTNALIHQPITVPDHGRPPPIDSTRLSTPVNLRKSTLKDSPRKEDIRKSIEEYYWKELKKIKEQEDYDFYLMQLSNGYMDAEAARIRRSRSLSPSSQQMGRGSLSLPPNEDSLYLKLSRRPIPEDQPLVLDDTSSLMGDQQNFARGNGQRRSFNTLDRDSYRRPIFRRGSLNQEEIYRGGPHNKKVSFSGPQQRWPARNVLVDNFQRRQFEDARQNNVVYSNERQPPIYSNQLRNPYANYAERNVPDMSNNRYKAMIDSQNRTVIYEDNVPPPPVRYQNQPLVDNSYLRNPLQRNVPNSVYSSRQSITNEPKQIRVNNKYCDIYGQIHDAPRTGTIMGQLQEPINQSPVYAQQSSFIPVKSPFVRNSRLSASANDIGQRYDLKSYYQGPPNVPVRRYNEVPSSYDSRPLPPIPKRQLNNK